MRTYRSIQPYQTEKMIVDALLKIYEIVKKTTHTKKISIDNNKKQSTYKYDSLKVHNRSIPSSTCTFESYMTRINRSHTNCALQQPLNFNRAPNLQWHSRSPRDCYRIDNTIRSMKRILTHKYQNYDEISSSSTSSLFNCQNRKASSRYHLKYELARYDKRRRAYCECHSHNI